MYDLVIYVVVLFSTNVLSHYIIVFCYFFSLLFEMLNYYYS